MFENSVLVNFHGFIALRKVSVIQLTFHKLLFIHRYMNNIVIYRHAFDSRRTLYGICSIDAVFLWNRVD